EQVVDRVVRTPRVLTIVNTRKQAARLFDAVRATGTPCRHLSALMCPQHRSARVAEIREALAKPDAPCRVISTQVVEAGIDIDFPVVYRAMAGLDSIIQSAGRCNREGRLSERGHVFVFDTDENPPPDIKRRIEATRDVLQDNADPLDLSTVEAWFREVYFRRKDEWDGGAGISVTADLAPDRLKFRSVAEQYNIIDQWSVPVVVPYEKEGAELCRLLQQSHKVEAHHLRQAQRYSVSVAPWALAHLQSQGHVTGGDTTLSVLISKSLYDDEVGLRLNGEPEPRDLCA
ncbi:MAG: CRISPR-associated helicase/endonuclease Cas3, partial [Planctomycetes bacterium]|nr:CRISPR-associated helicase/endonuclease Cas3 [Planctomycetota bacterium]